MEGDADVEGELTATRTGGSFFLSSGALSEQDAIKVLPASRREAVLWMIFMLFYLFLGRSLKVEVGKRHVVLHNRLRLP